MDENEKYTALMCNMQSAIARQDKENPHVNSIADLLNIRCRQLCNGGVFHNARALLADELERGGMFLSAENADIILAGDCPPFWHWEGDALRLDCYSLKAEKSFIGRSRAGHVAGVASGKARKAKSREGVGKGTNVGTNVGTINKEINTPYGSISKGTPPLGAGGAFDGDAHPDSEPATDEDMQAALDEMKRDFRDGTEHA